MAAYIPVPRDLTRVKTKVFFNLTKRQLICFGAAALIGVPLFFLVKSMGRTFHNCVFAAFIAHFGKKSVKLIKKYYPNTTVFCWKGCAHCYKISFEPLQWTEVVNNFLNN